MHTSQDALFADIGRGVAAAVMTTNRKSPGELFVESESFREHGTNVLRERKVDVDIPYSVVGARGRAALGIRAFASNDLAAVNVAPQGQLIALGVQRLTIMDLLSPGSTSAAAIPYPRENTTGTGGAATVGEGGLKPNWDPDLTTETASARKVAVMTKVPDEMLSDLPVIASFINSRLPYMVDFETEHQFLYGDGIEVNIRGITSTAGIQTRPYATNWGDTICKALTDIRVGSFFEPDGIVMHPYDWEVARLEKDLNGQYLAGGPTYLPYGNGVFVSYNTFWGLPVVVTTAVTVGKPVIGAWKLGAQFFVREGMRLEATNSNEDDFKRNLIAIRAEHRLALAVYRPVAFLEITGAQLGANTKRQR